MDDSAAAASPVTAHHVGRPLVVLSDVDKYFGDLHVLQKINLTIHSGEVVVVLGPSGSGKSTLCRAINRLETIQSGTISVDGRMLPDEGKALASLRADVGMVFQSFNLFSHKTVLQNVTLGPVKVRGLSSEEARPGAVEASRSRVPGRQVSRSALRRPTAARGHRPRARDGTEGDLVRRAHIGIGP